MADTGGPLTPDELRSATLLHAWVVALAATQMVKTVEPGAFAELADELADDPEMQPIARFMHHIHQAAIATGSQAGSQQGTDGA